MTIAYRFHVSVNPGREGLQCGMRLVLAHEADTDARDHDRDHDGGVDPLAAGEGCGRRKD